MNSTLLKSAAVGLVCGALLGCAGTGGVNPTAATDIQQALAAGCPILATVKASSLPTNDSQKSAIATLALACPPNPAPTSAIVAVRDIVSAYMTLRPLLKP